VGEHRVTDALEVCDRRRGGRELVERGGRLCVALGELDQVLEGRWRCDPSTVVDERRSVNQG